MEATDGRKSHWHGENAYFISYKMIILFISKFSDEWNSVLKSVSEDDMQFVYNVED